MRPLQQLARRGAARVWSAQRSSICGCCCEAPAPPASHQQQETQQKHEQQQQQQLNPAQLQLLPTPAWPPAGEQQQAWLPSHVQARRVARSLREVAGLVMGLAPPRPAGSSRAAPAHSHALFHSRARSSSCSSSDDEDGPRQHAAAMRDPTDLRAPHTWYPLARSMQRRLVAHLGPTNSGKTHAALQALAAAESGLYCGPLRLLACEVADRLNRAGTPCNLVTGQEVRRVRGAKHTAATVEMADLEARVDVAVVDEVQMLSDASRGWSWSRAVLGLPARELHLCGDPAVAGLLQQLADACGDHLTVQRYRRLSPLVVEPDALGGLSGVQDGDCVVAFGRKALHKLRKQVLRTQLAPHPRPTTGSGEAVDEPPMPPSPSQDAQQQQQQRGRPGAAGGCRVAMIYGALPPEARRMQASLFNESTGPCSGSRPHASVLVASDAVGMGLNLNIRRVVFSSLHKFDGVETRPLSASEIKQIAGRAGRYASGHTAGYVAVLKPQDLPALRAALSTPTPDVTHACLLPTYEHLEAFALDAYAAALAAQRRAPSFHRLLRAFVAAACVDDTAWRLGDVGNMQALARALRHLEPHLGLADMFTACISPACSDDGPVVQALLHIAATYAIERRVTPRAISVSPLPAQPPRSGSEMKAAEEAYRVRELWLWLAGRLGGPGTFSGHKRVLSERDEVARLIDSALRRWGRLDVGTPGPAQP